MTCPRHQEIIDALAGLSPPHERTEIERHIEKCVQCRAISTQVEELLGDLSPTKSETHAPQLARNVLTLVEMGRSSVETPTPGRAAPRWLAIAAAALLMVGAGLLLWNVTRSAPSSHRPHDTGLPLGVTPRGGDLADWNRWIAVDLYRAQDDKYVPVDGHIHADDALAFSYLNAGPTPMGFLMIFAVDPQGRVFWYYPAYETRDANPTSIPIEPAVGMERLPDEIQHDLEPGRLKVFAIFSKHKLDVHHVENAVHRSLEASSNLNQLGRLDLDDTAQQLFSLTVRSRGSQND